MWGEAGGVCHDVPEVYLFCGGGSCGIGGVGWPALIGSGTRGEMTHPHPVE
jgi:hypothetical protein